MVPPFKEAVEACFTEGLVKVVFATETLAVGINMPARTVVIEKLTKFTGEHHEFLTPGEYTQLTGRAGRRGIDTLGYAVVLWSPFVPFDQVASLASSRSFHAALGVPARPTTWRPTSCGRTPPSEAHHLLNLSFAQYQADRDVVRLEARLERRQARARRAAGGRRQPVRRHRRVPPADREPSAPSAPTGRRTGSRRALARLRPGDVVMLRQGPPRRPGGRAHRRPPQGRPRRACGCMTPHRVQLPLSTAELRRAAARRRARRPPDAVRTQPPVVPAGGGPGPRTGQDRAAPMRAPRAQGPGGRRGTRRSPSRRRSGSHRAAAGGGGQADRVQREVDDLRRQVKGRSESLARRFDRVLRLLEAWGYARRLAAHRRGASASPGSSTSATCSSSRACARACSTTSTPRRWPASCRCFTYEHRIARGAAGAVVPVGQGAAGGGSPSRRWPASSTPSRRTPGCTLTRAPDPTFLAVAYAWAAGEGFAEVVEDEELSGGDFVRNIKQLIDLLRQLGDLAPAETMRHAAAAAHEQLFRGVVAASTAVDAGDA